MNSNQLVLSLRQIQKDMKRLLFTLIAALAFVTSSYGQDDPDDPIPFPIVSQGDVGGVPIFRSPIIPPIQGCYSPSLNAVFITFSYYAGIVCYQLVNLDTNYSQGGTLSTAGGEDYIILPDVAGYYCIIISLYSQLYIGFFTIT